MKSGLSQNEKNKPRRIVIDHYDYTKLNKMLHNIAPIEKQIKYFEQSGITVPDELLAPFEDDKDNSPTFPYPQAFDKK